jgi:uncharacterized damage-inducible protein DinB
MDGAKSMTQQDLLLLYNYNFWANQRILAAAAQVSQEQFTPSKHFHNQEERYE